MQVTAILVAAGRGERAGGGIPKQFQRIGGKAVIARAWDALASHSAIGTVHVVVGAGQEAMLAEALGDRPFPPPLTGGATRRESVASGLHAAAGAELVLVHDAARPFLPHAVIDRVIAGLDAADGAVPVLPVADTLARGESTLGDVVARQGIWRVQTPQAFRAAALIDAHRRWDSAREATDDAQMVRAAGYEVTTVEGDARLEKLTTANDFALAQARVAMSTRTGLGFDVHRLAAGEALWLGGVRIEHDKGLVGHSDADVALHALTDAILGAIAAGDIGAHFPPTDPQWRGAPSARFLEHAATLVEAGGGRIEHVDLTIICEAPRIGPHREAMQARIGALLGLSPARVSVKATTTERLGFTGRGEGIAAHAVATVRIPEDM